MVHLEKKRFEDLEVVVKYGSCLQTADGVKCEQEISHMRMDVGELSGESY